MGGEDADQETWLLCDHFTIKLILIHRRLRTKILKFNYWKLFRNKLSFIFITAVVLVSSDLARNPGKVLKYDAPFISPKTCNFDLVCHDKCCVISFFYEIVWENSPRVGNTYIKFSGRHLHRPQNGQRIIVDESPTQLSVFMVCHLTVAVFW